MLATLAVGFLPVILRQFMEPEKPDIEIGTVSFSSKLDEIIKNFKQRWPIHDFPLEKATDDQNTDSSEKDQNNADDDANKAATEETALLHLDAETENKRNNSHWNAVVDESSIEKVDISHKHDWLIKCPTETDTPFYHESAQPTKKKASRVEEV